MALKKHTKLSREWLIFSQQYDTNEGTKDQVEGKKIKNGYCVDNHWRWEVHGKNMISYKQTITVTISYCAWYWKGKKKRAKAMESDKKEQEKYEKRKQKKGRRK